MVILEEDPLYVDKRPVNVEQLAGTTVITPYGNMTVISADLQQWQQESLDLVVSGLIILC